MILRALSYNIHKGFTQWNSQFVLHEIKKAIQATNADIVLLQEVVGDHQKLSAEISNWPTEGQFEFLADSIWPHFAYGKNAVFPSRHHGNAILSRFPILKWENIDLSNYRLEKRGLLHAEILLPAENRTLHLFNVHLDLTHIGRKRQLKKIIERIETSIGNQDPFLLAGDFNDWGQAATPWLAEHHVHESFLVLNGAHAQTFPSFFPRLHLDRAYYRSLKPLKAEVLHTAPWSKLSDHLPIFLEFELP